MELHVLYFLFLHHAESPSLCSLHAICCYWFVWNQEGMLFHSVPAPLLPLLIFFPYSLFFSSYCSQQSDCWWCFLETHSHCPDILMSLLVILPKFYFPCLFCCVCCMLNLFFSLILLWFLSRCVKREVASCQFGIIDMIQLQRSYCNT